MADTPQPLVQIPDVVGAGTQLASAIHTHLELDRDGKKTLQNVVHEINATVSALRQIMGIVAEDRKRLGGYNAEKVLKGEWHSEMQTAAVMCEKVYKLIATLIHNSKGLDFRPTKAREKKEQVGLLEEPELLLSLQFSAGERWKWLEPRMQHCQYQLRWLKLGLLCCLQLTQVASLQINTVAPTRDVFDREVTARLMSEGLRQRQRSLAKKVTKQIGTDRKLRRERAQINSGRPIPGWAPMAPRTVPQRPPIPVNAGGPTLPMGGTAIPPPPQVSPPAGLQSTAPPPFASVNAGNGTLKATGPATSNPEKPTVPTVAEILQESGANVPPYTPPANGNMLGQPGMPSSKSVGPHVADSKTAVSPPLGASDDKKDPEKKVSEEKSTAAPGQGSELTKLSPFRSRFPSFIRGWAHSVFGKDNGFLADISSTDLEAYVADYDGLDKPSKVPFGHQRLKYGLNRVLGSKKGDSWPSYLTASSHQRAVIDKVTKFANTQSARERTFLAIEECKKPGQPASYVVFFSLGEPAAPIYFKDAVGRKYEFAYQVCKEWQAMKDRITDVFLHVDVIGPHVRDGHYDLLGENGQIIPASEWSATIRPGTNISMHMWPMNKPNLPRPQPPGFQPPRPGMVPPPGARPPGVHSGGPPPPTGAFRPGMHPGMRPPGMRPIVVGKSKPIMKGKSSSVLSWMAGGAKRKYDMSSDEEKELTVVDFEELIGDNEETLAEMLARLTNARDVQCEWARNIGIADFFDSFSEFSGSSTSSSSSSEELAD
ncbi:hypothetical protein GQ53DRAFT_843159 [Thozetella sp. PMI_491]|nr:hypothetical protein GQ53DRAFT_843159 [Thozetella sp. PMI_491]